MAGIRSVPENKSTNNGLITWQKCELDNLNHLARHNDLKDEFTIDKTKVHMNRMRKNHSIQQNALIAFTAEAFKTLSHDNREAALEEAIAALQKITETDSTLSKLAQNSGAMVNGTISWEENNVYNRYTVQLGTNVSYISHDATTAAEPLHDIQHYLLKDRERIEQMGRKLFLRVIGPKTIGHRICNEEHEKKADPIDLVPTRFSVEAVPQNTAKIHKTSEGLFSIARAIGINSIPEISHIPKITSSIIPKTNMTPKKIIVGCNSLVDHEEKAFVNPNEISLRIYGSHPTSRLIQGAFNANDNSSSIACSVYEITKTVTAAFVFTGEGNVGKRIADACATQFCEIFSKILQNKLELDPNEAKAVKASSLKLVDVSDVDDVAIEENDSDLPLYGPLLPPKMGPLLPPKMGPLIPATITISISPPPRSPDMTVNSAKKEQHTGASSPAKMGTFANSQPKTEPHSPTKESRSSSPSRYRS